MKAKDLPEVSSKSTKDQILAAYTKALEQLQKKQLENPQDQKKKEEEKTLLSKATSKSAETILEELSHLKGKTLKQLDLLSEELLREFDQLSTVRDAITVEEKNLQDLYSITKAAEPLAKLLKRPDFFLINFQKIRANQQ